MKKKVNVTYRVMDTYNGGIEWGREQRATVEYDDESPSDEEDAATVAKQLNRASYAESSEIDPETLGDGEVPGELVRAAGYATAGIAWFDDVGHQGSTCVIIEWHETTAR